MPAALMSRLMDVIGSPGGGLTEQGTKDRVLEAANKAYAYFDAASRYLTLRQPRASWAGSRADNLAAALSK